MSAPRKKPHPNLTLASFFAAGSAPRAPLTPSQLGPRKIFDALATSPAQAYDGIPVEALVSAQGGDRSLPPLKHTIRFPVYQSGETDRALAEAAKDSSAVEIQVTKLGALDASEWAELERVVDRVSGSDGGRAVIISGILPPPIDTVYPSSRLHTAAAYAELWVPRVTEMSLNRHVYLKLLPPVLDPPARGEGGWWTDEEEVKRVTRLYVTPAMECFGSHRIMFGSAPPAGMEALVSRDRWFAVARTVVAELVGGSGDAEEARAEMDAVFYGNGKRIWGGA